jgi:hypothetical protein
MMADEALKQLPNDVKNVSDRKRRMNSGSLGLR